MRRDSKSSAKNNPERPIRPSNRQMRTNQLTLGHMRRPPLLPPNAAPFQMRQLHQPISVRRRDIQVRHSIRSLQTPRPPLISPALPVSNERHTRPHAHVHPHANREQTRHESPIQLQIQPDEHRSADERVPRVHRTSHSSSSILLPHGL